jgi:hypothetical protein
LYFGYRALLLDADKRASRCFPRFASEWISD